MKILKIRKAAFLLLLGLTLGWAPAAWPQRVDSTYNVSGANCKDVSKDIFGKNGKGPVDEVDGKKVAGSCRLSYSYTVNSNCFPRNDSCCCQLSGAAGQISIQVVKPNWTNKSGAPAADQAEWDRFAAALETHEAGHVAIYMAHKAAIEAAIAAALNGKTVCVSGGCPPSDAALDAAIAALLAADAGLSAAIAAAEAAQQQYENNTNHGATQGATLKCP